MKSLLQFPGAWKYSTIDEEEISPDFKLLVPDDPETADIGVFHYRRIDDDPEVDLIHKVYKRAALTHEQIQGIVSGVAENVPD